MKVLETSGRSRMGKLVSLDFKVWNDDSSSSLPAILLNPPIPPNDIKISIIMDTATCTESILSVVLFRLYWWLPPYPPNDFVCDNLWICCMCLLELMAWSVFSFLVVWISGVTSSSDGVTINGLTGLVHNVFWPLVSIAAATCVFRLGCIPIHLNPGVPYWHDVYVWISCTRILSDYQVAYRRIQTIACSSPLRYGDVMDTLATGYLRTVPSIK